MLGLLEHEIFSHDVTLEVLKALCETSVSSHIPTFRSNVVSSSTSLSIRVLQPADRLVALCVPRPRFSIMYKERVIEGKGQYWGGGDDMSHCKERVRTNRCLFVRNSRDGAVWVYNYWVFSFLWPCIVRKVWRLKNQQNATIRCLLLISISTCFGHYYAHLQENKCPVTAFGVLSGSAGCGW